MVRAATAHAVRASISTPVRSTISVTALISILCASTVTSTAHPVDPDGMAQGDERRGLFGRLDPGEAGPLDDVESSGASPSTWVASTGR